MNTINIDFVEELSLPKRKIKVLVGGKSPLKSEYMTFGITTIGPGIKVDPHRHQKEEEVIYILSGKGYIEIDGNREELEEGTAVRLPIGSEHLIHNTSSIDMKFIFCFNAKIDVGSYDNK